MVLGIDPGSRKFGWALSDENGAFCASGLVPADSLDIFARDAATSPVNLRQWLLEGEIPSGIRIEKVFCGDGTGHSRFVQALSQRHFDVSLVKELNTTLEARALYWTIHPPRGLRKLIPLSLQVPPRNLDDLAACCILRRALQGKTE